MGCEGERERLGEGLEGGTTRMYLRHICAIASEEGSRIGGIGRILDTCQTRLSTRQKDQAYDE